MNGTFYITDENNNKIECEILYCFKDGDKNFVFYNDGSINEDGTKEVLSSKFIIDNNQITLLPIENDEWDIVDKNWSEIYE